MKLRRTVESIFCAGAVLAAAFAWMPGEARADQKKTSTATTQTAAPAKPAPAPARQAQPATARPVQPTTARPVQPATARPGQPTTARPGQPGAARPPVGPGGAVGPKPRNEPIRYQSHAGEQATPLRNGGQEFHNPQTGRTVRTDARGQVTHIEAPRGLAGGSKMVINRGPGGRRMVETGRPGARVVSYGPHRGFVERTGRPGYISRTYFVGGRSYAHVYREYGYHGVRYYRYVPGVYYGPRFYAWAVTPWGVPVRYAWGGGFTAPWFGFYAGYFTPYPVYASPDLWLTDYLMAENLRLAYENQQAANADQAPPPQPYAQSAAATLSPEMKALIADEVRQQLAAEKAAAVQPTSASAQQPASGSEQLPPALSQRFFVVSSNLDITTTAGQACSLTPGDIIERKGKTLTADGGLPVGVVSGKPGDCAADSEATVQLADLQEMHNQFREQIDSGLKTLAANQAKGLPNGPAAGARPVEEGTAEPVADVESQLITQEGDAAKLEDQVRQDGSGS